MTKIPRNTANKGCEEPLQGELQTTAQGSKRVWVASHPGARARD